MGHDHTDELHSHDAAVHHTPKNFGLAFGIAAALNAALIIAQVIYGLLTNSVALLADAVHNFSDVLGLLLAWAAYAAAKKAPTSRYTYGYRSGSILAALFNSVLLFVMTGGIGWEAFRRLAEPGEVAGLTVIIVAAIGIVVNGGSALLLMSGHSGDLNMRGAFLHLLADAGVSAAVVVAGLGIVLTGWRWLDPVASLLVSVVIVWSTWGLLREALRLTLNAVPTKIDPTLVGDYLRGLPGVASIHDLHIWAMSTTETALTVHLVMPKGHPGDKLLSEIAAHLQHTFNIDHPTIQIEVSADYCKLAPELVV